jgi:hypothetical protein
MPDQPWTAWWEIEDAQLTAPREDRSAVPAPATPAPDAKASDHATAAVIEPTAPVATSTDEAADPLAFPHVDATSGGGLRRVGVDAPTPEPAAPAAAPANWGVVETAATGAATPVGVHTVYGRFSVEGVARRPGDLVFTGVTFPDAVSAVPPSGAIELTIDGATNVVPDGVVVADMGGFAADRQGFTLITTSLGEGPVRVDGHYVVEI